MGETTQDVQDEKDETERQDAQAVSAKETTQDVQDKKDETERQDTQAVSAKETTQMDSIKDEIRKGVGDNMKCDLPDARTRAKSPSAAWRGGLLNWFKSK